MLVVLGGPGLEHDLFGLEQALVCLGGVDAVALVVVDVVGGARPSPTSKRPRLILSISAICSAMRTGWWSDIWATANPMRMRSVLAASAAAKVTGST